MSTSNASDLGRIQHKRQFTAQEDQLLRKAVEKYGTKKWEIVSQLVPGRNVRQCRERWENYVDPSLKQRKWTLEEDEILIKVYDRLGPRWRLITGHFDGRSVNNVKNRYSYLKKQGIINNMLQTNDNKDGMPKTDAKTEEKPVAPCLVDEIFKLDSEHLDLFSFEFNSFQV